MGTFRRLKESDCPRGPFAIPFKTSSKPIVHSLTSAPEDMDATEHKVGERHPVPPGVPVHDKPGGRKMRSTAALFTAGGQQPGRFFFARAAWQRRKQEVAAVQESVLLKALFQRALPEALQGVLPVAHLEMLPIRIGRPPRGTLPPSDATLERRPPCITTVWNFRFSQASIICPRGELFPTLAACRT